MQLCKFLHKRQDKRALSSQGCAELSSVSFIIIYLLVNCRVAGASKGIPGDAKCVTENNPWGTKIRKLGGDNTVLVGHSTVPLPFQ